MKEIFVDTYYFIAILSPSDAAHDRAREITRDEPAQLVTTAWVLTELANALAKRETRGGFLRILDALRNNPTAVVVEYDQQLHDAGIELYRSRPDKDWSLTDCISFLVMEHRKISDALTGDHHFKQAGFTTLL
jgi:predicted nucleic acid-binding protein